jgi:hypothetical protein
MNLYGTPLNLVILGMVLFYGYFLFYFSYVL